MDSTFRSAGSRVNVVVGPLVMLIGVGTAITAVVLTLVLGEAGFLALLIPAVLALGGGAFVLWGARRSRLRIDAAGFRWAGLVGAEQSVRWEQLQRIAPPTPGDRRLVAFALLHDGTAVPVRALWEPATVPSVLSGGPDHPAVQHALVTAHQQWLGARGGEHTPR